MKRLKLSVVFILLLTASAFAALNFPALTGRVVDEAHVLSPATVQSLDQTLAGYEKATTNQLVVVTVKSLQGVPIEQYGYQLGRSWGIGQKGKNNGVILLVAPKERKVRIEVGYGLEGDLTDARCSEIIQSIILPAFRAGKMEQGITDGVQAIIGNQPVNQVSNGVPDMGKIGLGNIIFLIILALLFLGKIILLFSPRFFLRHPFLSTMFLMSNTGGGSSFGGGSGGFSGGGGSFGGGGSSGGW